MTTDQIIPEIHPQKWTDVDKEWATVLLASAGGMLILTIFIQAPRPAGGFLSGTDYSWVATLLAAIGITPLLFIFFIPYRDESQCEPSNSVFLMGVFIFSVNTMWVVSAFHTTTAVYHLFGLVSFSLLFYNISSISTIHERLQPDTNSVNEGKYKSKLVGMVFVNAVGVYILHTITLIPH